MDVSGSGRTLAEVPMERFNEFFFGTLLAMAIVIVAYGVVSVV